MSINFRKLDNPQPEFRPSGKICLFCKNDMQTGIILKFKGKDIHICKTCMEGFESGKLRLASDTNGK